MDHILVRLKKRFKMTGRDMSAVVGTNWSQLERTINQGLSPRHKYVCRAYQYAKAHGIHVTIEELMEE